MVKLIIVIFPLILSVNFVASCEKDSVLCYEQNVESFIEKLDEETSIPVVANYVTLDKRNDVNYNVARDSNGIVSKSLSFLMSRELKIKLSNEESRSLTNLSADGRSSKIKKILLPILLLLKLKAAIVLPIILSVIALISFKGMGASLIALALSGATALKSLLDNHGSKISYEIVPPLGPHWSRAGLEPLSPYGSPYIYGE